MEMDLETIMQSRHTLVETGGRDILEKAYKFDIADQLRAIGLYPYFQPLDFNEGCEGVINGKRVIMLGSNNYLGLTTHPRVRQAAMKAVSEYGTSMTGSRFLNGSLKLHETLENEIADFLGRQASIVFTTGYQANLGVMSALVNKASCAVIDKFDHASIYDGCALSEGELYRFSHNDMEDLRRVLSKIPSEKGILVIVDGVFSMEGDIAPLPQIVDICSEFNARLMVDDAHAIGVIGEGGRGTPHFFGVNDKVDIVVGTFSKSLASIGGFVAGDAKVIDYIKHFGRPMIFSASSPPASIAAAREALKILREEGERVEKLNKNAKMMRDALRSLGYNIGRSETPIIPIIIGNEFTTIFMWKELLDEGVYVNPILFPAVPKSMALLRTSVTATHTEEQIEKALWIFQKVGKNHAIIS